MGLAYIGVCASQWLCMVNWERLPCAHRTSGGDIFPLGRQRRARFGKFCGQHRECETKPRQIGQVSGHTTQIQPIQ